MRTNPSTENEEIASLPLLFLRDVLIRQTKQILICFQEGKETSRVQSRKAELSPQLSPQRTFARTIQKYPTNTAQTQLV